MADGTVRQITIRIEQKERRSNIK